VDPDSLNPDLEPAFQVNPDRDPVQNPGDYDKKKLEKIELKKFVGLF
jgi:hypothetical protein